MLLLLLARVLALVLLLHNAAEGAQVVLRLVPLPLQRPASSRTTTTRVAVAVAATAVVRIGKATALPHVHLMTAVLLRVCTTDGNRDRAVRPSSRR